MLKLYSIVTQVLASCMCCSEHLRIIFNKFVEWIRFLQWTSCIVTPSISVKCGWHVLYICKDTVFIMCVYVCIYITICYCVPHCHVANWHWRTQTAGISHHGVRLCSSIWQEAQQCYKWGKEPPVMRNLHSSCPLTVLSYLVAVMGLSSNKTMIIRRYANPILLASMAHEPVVQMRNWKVL
jgi:hypothetical protein